MAVGRPGSSALSQSHAPMRPRPVRSLRGRGHLSKDEPSPVGTLDQGQPVPGREHLPTSWKGRVSYALWIRRSPPRQCPPRPFVGYPDAYGIRALNSRSAQRPSSTWRAGQHPMVYGLRGLVPHRGSLSCGSVNTTTCSMVVGRGPPDVVIWSWYRIPDACPIVTCDPSRSDPKSWRRIGSMGHSP
jgi:hypothetical protein